MRTWADASLTPHQPDRARLYRLPPLAAATTGSAQARPPDGPNPRPQGRRRAPGETKAAPLEAKAGVSGYSPTSGASVADRPYAHSVKRPRVIYLITGPMAAGKSTVARLLASRFEKGVYLEGDVFRRNIVSGRVDMTPDPSSEAIQQLHLRYQLTAAAADGYFDAGFSVVLEDVVAGPILDDYRSMIRSRPCHVIVLLPSVEAVAAREEERHDKGYGAWTVEQLYDGFVSETPPVGLWLDTTNLTPEETVEEILTQTNSTPSP